MVSKLDLLRELVLVVVPSKFIQMGQTKPLFINFSPFQTTFYRKKHFTAKKTVGIIVIGIQLVSRVRYS